MKYSGVEWLGKIPHDWEVLKAKRIFKLKNEKNSELKPLLSVSKGRGLLLREEMVNRPTHAQKNIEAFKLVGDGDFVIHLRSFQSGFELSSIEGAVSPAYTVFNARKNDEVCNKYYKYIFYSKPFIDKIASTTLSLRDGKPISYDEFSITLLPVPNYIEQQKIATFLDEKVAHIDNIIENTKKSIENLKAYKQSLITETVTKGLDPNVEMKDSGIEWIGDIPKHWNPIKLKYLVELRNEKKNYKKGDRYIGLENIESYNGRINSVQIDYNSGLTDFFKKGDVLFNKLRPYLAKGFIAEFDAFGSGELLVLTQYKGDKRFLLYYLLSSKFIDVINSSTYGAKMPRANWDFIKELSIISPTKEEQGKIADFLDEKSRTIDSTIEQKKQLVIELESYKKSLIYEYVTGKKEVK